MVSLRVICSDKTIRNMARGLEVGGSAAFIIFLCHIIAQTDGVSVY